jgi:hypothetical protein
MSDEVRIRKNAEHAIPDSDGNDPQIPLVPIRADSENLRKSADDSGSRESMNGANGRSDIEGSEPDWQSDEVGAREGGGRRSFNAGSSVTLHSFLFCRSGSDVLGSLFP